MRISRAFSNLVEKIVIKFIPLKVIQKHILDKQKMRLETDVLQFGFKKNSSTVICTSILKETIDYYNENKTDSRRPLTELNIIKYSIDCVTEICVQLYYDY